MGKFDEGVKKNGKLLISHRYNRLPLLPSDPGGFSRSWSYKTCRGKYRDFAFPSNRFDKKFLK